MYYTRLAQLRGNRTQTEMASMLDMSQQTYSNYESGKQPLKSTQIEYICTRFGCSAEWLLCFDVPVSIHEETDPTMSELMDLFTRMDQPSRDALILVARSLAAASKA